MNKILKIMSNENVSATKKTYEGSYTMIDLKDSDADMLINLEKNKKIKKISLLIEYGENILDDIEKKYLKNIIKPFIDEVDYITKWENLYEEEYSIIITFYNFETITLPSFPMDSKMYVGMEPDREYSLKELDLI